MSVPNLPCRAVTCCVVLCRAVLRPPGLAEMLEDTKIADPTAAAAPAAAAAPLVDEYVPPVNEAEILKAYNDLVATDPRWGLGREREGEAPRALVPATGSDSW